MLKQMVSTKAIKSLVLNEANAKFNTIDILDNALNGEEIFQLNAVKIQVWIYDNETTVYEEYVFPEPLKLSSTSGTHHTFHWHETKLGEGEYPQECLKTITVDRLKKMLPEKKRGILSLLISEVDRQELSALAEKIAGFQNRFWERVL